MPFKGGSAQAMPFEGTFYGSLRAAPFEGTSYSSLRATPFEGTSYNSLRAAPFEGTSYGSVSFEGISLFLYKLLLLRVFPITLSKLCCLNMALSKLSLLKVPPVFSCNPCL